MPAGRIHHACQKPYDGQLRQAKRRQARGKADHGPQDRLGHLFFAQHSKVPASAVGDSLDGYGNGGPAADLEEAVLVFGRHRLAGGTYHGCGHEVIVKKHLANDLSADK